MPATRKKSARKISPKKTAGRTARASTKRKAATKKPAAKTSQQDSRSNTALDNILTINNLSELQTTLAALIDNEDDIELDASGIEMIDTAALQLLLAFVYQRRTRQRRTSLIDPSDTFVSNVETLGLSAALDMTGNP